jgi:hypothetical protein
MDLKFVNLTREDFLRDYQNLYRFVPLHRFIEIFEKKALTFVYLGLWKDPFERFFLEAKYRLDGKDFDLPIKNRLFSMCWSRTKESEAFWNTYVQHNDGVRIQVGGIEMLNMLDAFCAGSSYQVFIGKVRYLNILELKKYEKDWKFIRQLNSSFLNVSHIELMLLKRRPFEFEDEIRILLFPDEKRRSIIYEVPVNPREFIRESLLDPRMEEVTANMIKSYFRSEHQVNLKKSRLYAKKKILIQAVSSPSRRF